MSDGSVYRSGSGLAIADQIDAALPEDIPALYRDGMIRAFHGLAMDFVHNNGTHNGGSITRVRRNDHGLVFEKCAFGSEEPFSTERYVIGETEDGGYHIMKARASEEI